MSTIAALVSSLLTEASHSQSTSSDHQILEKENTSARLISRLLLSDWNESVEQIVPSLFNMINHSEVSQKIIGWQLLPVLLRSQYRRQSFVTKPLCQFIDKQILLHNIKEISRYSSNPQFIDVISDGVDSILALSLDVAEVSVSLDSQLVKVISSCLELIVQIDDHNQSRNSVETSVTLFSVHVLTYFATVKGRLFTPQQLSNIISINFQLLSHAFTYSAAANLLAICASFASCELYENLWKCLTSECTRLLHILGLGSSGESGKEKGTTKPGDMIQGLRVQVEVHSTDRKLTGIHKAMFIEVSYRGLCAALARLAVTGNSSGPITLELKSDLATSVNIAICHRPYTSSRDTKYSIENRGGISPAHVSIIWPQLTLHSLSLLTVLLSTMTASPLSFPLAGTACSCIASALSHVFPSDKKTDSSMTSSETLTACALKALQCFQRALLCFPTVVLSKCENTVLRLVSVFHQQVHHLTSDPQVEGDIKNSFITNKELIIATFNTCETLLITTSSFLKIEIRQQLETAVSLGLKCVAKGVVLQPILTPDQGGNSFTSQRILKQTQQNKKVRRELCELIRQDVVIQKYFLLLSCAEVQTSYMDGSRSANLPLLNTATRICANHEVTAVVCGRIGLSLGNILFPAGVGLPSPPVIEVAQRKIAEHSEYIQKLQAHEELEVQRTSSRNMRTLEVSSRSETTSVDTAVEEMIVEVEGQQEATDDRRQSPPIEDSRKRKLESAVGSSTENNNKSSRSNIFDNSVNLDQETPKVDLFRNIELLSQKEKSLFSSSASSDRDIIAKPMLQARIASESSDDDDELPDINIDADLDA